MGDECQFPVEYNPKKFIFVKDRYFRIFKFDERVIVHFCQLTEMYSSCFAFGDSYIYPMSNFPVALLQLMLGVTPTISTNQTTHGP